MAVNERSNETLSAEAALRNALAPPSLPADFRAKTLMRLAAEEGRDAEAQRQAVEAEWQQLQEQLRQESVVLRWRTLVGLLGGAFAAGATVMAVMPWVTAHWGDGVARWIPVGVAATGLLVSWARVPEVRRWLS
jgi:hypothetical protein